MSKASLHVRTSVSCTTCGASMMRSVPIEAYESGEEVESVCQPCLYSLIALDAREDLEWAKTVLLARITGRETPILVTSESNPFGTDVDHRALFESETFEAWSPQDHLRPLRPDLPDSEALSGAQLEHRTVVAMASASSKPVQPGIEGFRLTREDLDSPFVERVLSSMRGRLEATS